MALLYLVASMGPALYDQNEAQYAGAVREMLNRPADYLPGTRHLLERGHWWIPTNDGVPRLQKPPLVYWCILVSMSTFGVDEFAARLPNALAALAWFAGIYMIGRRIGGEVTGRAAATILATMAGTFIFCHLIAPEPFLAASLTWTFVCFLKACDDTERSGRRWIFGAWICMALGVACKGLHGALYPLAVAAVLAWRLPATRPSWRLLFRPEGPIVFLLLLVPWYYAIESRYPGFLRDQFINEQLGHVFNRRYPSDSSQVPLYLFLPEHLIFFLPWTFFIPAAFSRRSTAVGATAELEWKLLGTWFAVTAISVLFSSRQDYYLLTAWGPVAIWMARAWAADPRRPLPRWTRVLPGISMAAIGTAALGTAGWLRAHTVDGDGTAPGTLRDTLAGTVEGIPIESWHRLLPFVWTTGATFLVTGFIAVVLAMRGRWRFVLPMTATAMIIVLACAARGLVVLEDHFSLRELALVVDHDTRDNTSVVCAGPPTDSPSVLFYINREVQWVGAARNEEFATRVLGIGQSQYLNDDDFLRLWADRSRAVYLIVEKDEFPVWRDRLKMSDDHALPQWHSGTRVMLCNVAVPH